MGALRVVVGTVIAAGLGLGVGCGTLLFGGVRSGALDGLETRPPVAPSLERPVQAPRDAGVTAAPAGASVVSDDTTFVPSASRPVPRFLLGLNEAVSIPGRTMERGDVTSAWIEQQLTRDAASSVALGARMVRSHTGAFPRNSWHGHKTSPDATAHADAWVRAVQGAGLEPLMMVSPWPGNRTANATERYVPDDMDAYAAYVRATVERYDGDGVDDMPGLRGPIRYWEVDNEPDLKFTMPPKGAKRDVPVGSFCSPKEAATVLVATSKAIKEAYPSALVLNGGIYRPAHEAGKAYLRDLFAEPGVRDAVDVVSLHNYADDEAGELFTRAVENARAIVGDKPIFMTETSVPSEGDKPHHSEEWQARMVAAFVGRAAVSGVHALLWHTLADPPRSARLQGGFSRHSLFVMDDQGGNMSEKRGAPVFRNLAARLAEDDLLGAQAAGRGAVRARSGAILLYEGSRVAKSGGTDLRTGKAIAAAAEATAPAWLWP